MRNLVLQDLSALSREGFLSDVLGCSPCFFTHGDIYIYIYRSGPRSADAKPATSLEAWVTLRAELAASPQ